MQRVVMILLLFVIYSQGKSGILVFIHSQYIYRKYMQHIWIVYREVTTYCNVW